MKYRDTKRILSTSVLASLLLVILVVFSSHAGGQESQVLSLETRIPPTATTGSLIAQFHRDGKRAFVQEWGKLFVAVPAEAQQTAEVRVYQAH